MMKMNSDSVLIITVCILVILFAGEPDLIDALIERIRCKG